MRTPSIQSHSRIVLLLASGLLAGCSGELLGHFCQREVRAVYAEESPEFVRRSRSVRDLVKQNRILEMLASDLDRLPLARPTQVVMAECESYGIYEAATSSIVVCYDLVREALARARTGVQVDSQLASVRLWFYHEVGHLLVDHHHAAITGHEEDVADQVAFHLVRTLHPESATSVLSWMRTTAAQVGRRFDPSDIHRPTQQRYVDLVCWFSGAGLLNAQVVATHEALAPERQQQCAEEAAQVTRGLRGAFGRWLDSNRLTIHSNASPCPQDTSFRWPATPTSASPPMLSAEDVTARLDLELEGVRVPSLGLTEVEDAFGAPSLGRCADVDSVLSLPDASRCSALHYVSIASATVRIWPRDPTLQACREAPQDLTALLDVGANDEHRWLPDSTLNRWALSLSGSGPQIRLDLIELLHLRRSEARCAELIVTLPPWASLDDLAAWQRVLQVAEWQVHLRQGEDELTLEAAEWKTTVAIGR